MERRRENEDKMRREEREKRGGKKRKEKEGRKGEDNMRRINKEAGVKDENIFYPLSFLLLLFIRGGKRNKKKGSGQKWSGEKKGEKNKEREKGDQEKLIDRAHTCTPRTAQRRTAHGLRRENCYTPCSPLAQSQNEKDVPFSVYAVLIGRECLK